MGELQDQAADRVAFKRALRIEMRGFDYTEEQITDALMVAHHRDCDGWRMHSVKARQEPSGTWKPHCPLCGELPMIGSAGSAKAARRVAGEHSHFEPCDGRCMNWKG